VSDLAPLTTLGVGGPAHRFFAIRRREEIVSAFAVADLRGEPLWLLGGGSNVVIADAGLPGTVVQILGGSIGKRLIGDEAIEWTVDAGVAWDDFVTATVEAGATGVELLSGIPGTVGAAPVQNVAAYGQQVCDVITAVGVYDRDSGQTGEVPPEACGFGFRTSRFKHGDWAGRAGITHVRLRLPLAAASPPVASTYGDLVRWFDANGGDPTDVATRREATLAVRRRKSMVIDPADPMSRSAGSFFVNPEVPAGTADELIDRFARDGLDVQYLEGRRAADPGAQVRRIPAALLLRAAGFRPGDSWGTVQLSDHHVLAIVARDGATADDIWQLSWLIRGRVEAETGIELQPEPQFLGEFADADPTAFEASHLFSPGAAGEPAWLRT
jgi:UDP-N-acetylmuramate dehydrogenase